jgi:hypothetical protein
MPMTGSGIIDLIIAMALFYFALSAVCSALNDLVARMFELRAINFKAAIHSLFNAKEGQPHPFVDGFYQHPLVQTLVRETNLAQPGYMKRLQTWIVNLGTRFRNILRAIVGLATKSLTNPELPKPEDKLAFVSSNQFVQVLLDLMKPEDWKGNQPLSFDDFCYLVNNMKDPDLKKILQALGETTDRTIEGIRKALADWFDQTMSHATVWYTRYMRAISIGVATVLCLLFNIDSIETANRFYADSSLRAAFVIIAETEAKKPLKEQRDPNEMAKLVSRLDIGWKNLGNTWPEIGNNLLKQFTFLKIVGLMITILAISMGAPFWYDLVGQMIKRKNPPGTPSE